MSTQRTITIEPHKSGSDRKNDFPKKLEAICYGNCNGGVKRGRRGKDMFQISRSSANSDTNPRTLAIDVRDGGCGLTGSDPFFEKLRSV